MNGFEVKFNYEEKLNLIEKICMKIKGSLEVFEQHGVKHSELLKAQRIAGGSGLGGPLRYRNAILLWINCDMSNNLRRLNLSYKLFHKENIV
ncbi:tRNA dimethylallyltransferase isoform X1 [Apis mellifera caucasica]|nr:tRNA dimethylallyltransferase isoform X1 [Apis mellifera caucasica]KAG9436233.1 tRNA dimethylallyltransferase isoform X1 [Apis mellifera carnica]